MPSSRRVRWWSLLWLFTAPLGCLSEPEGLDCARTPDAPACAVDRGPDAAPALDLGADGAAADADTSADVGPAADVGADARPADATADAMPDAMTPADAAVDMAPDPCTLEACPAPPVESACVGSTVGDIGEALCLPAACGDDDPDCDPAQLACRAHLGCVYWCQLVESREGCQETCRMRHLEAGGEAEARFTALAACVDGAPCAVGPDGEACRRAACGAELDACVGEGNGLWFLRPPRPGSAITCDYPLSTGEACGEQGLSCRQGACVDADGPCVPDPCPPRAPLGCDADTLVETDPPVCRDVDGAAVCDYAETRTVCQLRPARCAGDTLITDREARCVDDAQGVYCGADELSTDCAAAAPAPYCVGNDAVAIRPGSCALEGGEASCTAHREESNPCPAGQFCNAGGCTPSNCRTRCDNRDLIACDRGGVEFRVRCTREQRCTTTDCAPLPDIHGAACRSAEDSEACEAAGLFCRGRAAVPFCLLGETARTGRQTCWTTDDCEAGNICTRQGQCSPGTLGSACEDDQDCRDLRRCQRGSCR